MFAKLGDIKFDLITYFNGLEIDNKYEYVEHKVIEGKPLLQYMGESLETDNIRLHFHQSFCEPRAEIRKLKELAKKHQAVDFMFGNGEQKGKFVIQEVSSVFAQTDKFGNIIAAEVYVGLKEWVEDKKLETKKAQNKAQAKTRAANKRKNLPKQKKKVIKVPKKNWTPLNTHEKQYIDGIVRRDWLSNLSKTDYAKVYGTISPANTSGYIRSS